MRESSLAIEVEMLVVENLVKEYVPVLVLPAPVEPEQRWPHSLRGLTEFERGTT